MTPTVDRVIIEPTPDLVVTAGGLFIPDQYRATQNVGTVLEIGEGRMLPCGTRAPWDVSVGDRVIYSRFNGHEFTVPGGERVLLRSRDLMAVL